MSWILIDPPPISFPFRTKSYAFAFTSPGLVLSNSSWSNFGDVNGWCIAWYLFESSSHSKSGKSVTHKGANSLGFLKPKFSATCSLRALNCARTLFFSPDNTKIISPFLAPVISPHLAKSTWLKNLSTDDLKVLSSLYFA